jgi:steroid 5-alpha reductase family enzyme
MRKLPLVLVTLWGLHLSIYLLCRNWGEDFLYLVFRQKYGPDRYWWFSFFQVFMLQVVLAWLSLPTNATLNNSQMVLRLAHQSDPLI